MKNILFVSIASFLLLFTFDLYGDNNSKVAEVRSEIVLNGNFYKGYELGKSYIETIEDLSEEQIALNFYVGFCAVKRSESEQVIKYYLDRSDEMAVRIFGEENKYSGLIDLTYAILYMEKDTPLSIEYVNSALKILAPICGLESQEVGVAKNILGYITFMSGDIENGQVLLSESFDILDYVGNQQSWLYANCLARRSMTYLLMQDAEAAIDDIGSAVDLFSLIGLEQSEAAIFTYKSFVLQCTIFGLTADAIATANVTLQLLEAYKLTETLDYTSVLMYLGKAYELTGDYASAKKYYIKSKEGMEKIEGATETSDYKTILQMIEILEQNY